LLVILPRNPQDYLDTLSRRAFPYVLIDHQGLQQITHSGATRAQRAMNTKRSVCPSVGATNWRGAFEATRYLLQLGHRRIGFITGYLEMGCARERLAGYEAALAEHGIEVDPSLSREGDFHQPRGYAAAHELLSLRQPPTAIFASNDISAFGAMEAVRERGLSIPGDVSVIGFDNIPQAMNVHPTLTTVRQPLEQMGQEATRMLLSRIADPTLPDARIELSTELIIRSSCAAPQRKRRKGGDAG
jgi:LacI family transcriptional regulator